MARKPSSIAKMKRITKIAARPQGWFIVVGLFCDIFRLFWILEGVVFDDFDWDPILESKTKNVLRV